MLVQQEVGLDILPVSHESPIRDCTLNSVPVLSMEIEDEYRVIHSEDESDQDTKSIGDEEEDDETRETKASGPAVDADLNNEVQQAIDNQGLSPRSHKRKVPTAKQATTTSKSVNQARRLTRSQSQSL